MVLGRGKLSSLGGAVRISNRDPQGVRFAGVAVRNLPHKLSNWRTWECSGASKQSCLGDMPALKNKGVSLGVDIATGAIHVPFVTCVHGLWGVCLTFPFLCLLMITRLL